MKTKEEILQTAKDIAERFSNDLTEGDFAPTITYGTEGDQMRLMLFPNTDPDPQARNMLAWAVTVLAASIDNLDSITFATDSYHTTSPTKKDGTPWGPGGMQYAVENNTEDAELVFDCLSVMYMAPNQRGMASIPYRKTDKGIEFLDDEAKVLVHGDGDHLLEGGFVEMMGTAFEAPKIIEALDKHNIDPDDFGLDEDQARLHCICIAVKMVMLRTGMRCIIPCHSAEEQDLFKTSFNEGPFSEGFRAFDQDQVEEIIQLEEAFEGPAFEKP